MGTLTRTARLACFECFGPMSALRAAHIPVCVHGTRKRADSTRRVRSHSICADATLQPKKFNRRDALTGAVLLSTSLSNPLSTNAEILTPKGYDAPLVSNNGWNTLETGGDTLGCAYSMEWPSGWCALSDLSSARTVGVDASWKDPTDEASTLAVFISRVDSSIKSQSDRGTIHEIAKTRAESAPRQVNIGKRKRMTIVGENKKIVTYDVETKVGGGTAGRFGAAVELVSVTVYDGKEYLIRATASGASWNVQKNTLRRAVTSFKISEKC